MSTLAMECLQIANRLRRGIEQGELCLFYQPQINISIGEVVGLEALLCWQHPALGIILPGEFISLAEESGQNHAIGDWVLQEVCNQVASWQRVGIIPLRIANNGSPVQFVHSDLIENVLDAIKNKCLVPNHLGCDRAKDIYLPGRCRPSRY